MAGVQERLISELDELFSIGAGDSILLSQQKNQPQSQRNYLSAMGRLRSLLVFAFRHDIIRHERVFDKFETCLVKLVSQRATFGAFAEPAPRNALYFDYSFFRLIKFCLAQEHLVDTETSLIRLMSYCLTKCCKQYHLLEQMGAFAAGSNNSSNNESEYDAQDGINQIELSVNFQTNLLNILHRFREVHQIISSSRISTETRPLGTNSLSFYDYMSSLLSTYVDTSLHLIAHHCKNHAGITCDVQLGDLDHTMCLNVVYLLDSCAYYICNTLLQVTAIATNNLKYIVPLIKKLVELKERHGDESSNKIKMSRSLYVRMMICYRGLIVLADQTDECKQMLLFFKKFIFRSVELPLKLNAFVETLATNFVSSPSPDRTSLLKLLAKMQSSAKLRKLIMFRLEKGQLHCLLVALQNRTQFKSNTSITPEVNPNADTSTIVNELNRCYSRQRSDNERRFGMRLRLKRLDISKYRRIASFTYDLRPCQPDAQTEETESPAVSTMQTNGDSVHTSPQTSIQRQTRRLSKSDFDRLMADRTSPTPNTISRLNLFRRIFDSDDEHSTANNNNASKQIVNKNNNNNHNTTIPNNNSTSTASNTNARHPAVKWYKLNELTSVMINQDYISD